MKISLDHFIDEFSISFPDVACLQPWEVTDGLKIWLKKIIPTLADEYSIDNFIAIHPTALIEKGVVIKSPAIIGPDCIVCANAYLREGVYLERSVKIGPGCEIKSSIICSGTSIAHFNYLGNSIVGRNVNFEAGSIAANHYNERNSKNISVCFQTTIIQTNTEKFGSLVGDNSKIGANAVLSPGTLLEKGAIVGRLELITQI